MSALWCAPALAQAPALDFTELAMETNPAVQAALELPRQQPRDYFRAIIWLLDLGRPALAKPILDDLVKLQLTDEQLAALVAEFGSRSMLRVARADELAPAGAKLANASMAAAAKLANDPQRIAALVAQLTDPSPEVRQIARADLAAIGKAGVTATVEAFARETNSERRRLLAAAAARMHPLVVGQLLALVEASDARLRADALEILKLLRVSQVAPFIAVETGAAERTLLAAMERYKRGTPPFTVDDQNQIELWHWDDATQMLTSARYPVEAARTIWLAQLAQELARRRPDVRLYQRQAMLLGLEAERLLPARRKSPTSEQLNSVDTSTLNELLGQALADDHADAAVVLADALGERGDAGVLYVTDAQPSPLANALGHSNRRVRFAALRAIVTIDPPAAFPGSSRVPETLAWFARSTGTRQALVAMPTNAAATQLAGMLAAHELEAEATNRGRDAVAMAREMPDLEMLFIDANLIVPDIRQVLYELRVLPTTTAVPIALLAAEGRLADAERLAEDHERMLATSRPHSAEVLARIVEDLTLLRGRDASTPEERAAQAVQAITWLARLAAGDRPFYKIRRSTPVIEAAIYNPSTSGPAIRALGRIGTPQSQQALVSFASQSTLPQEARARAAAAFRTSVERHGVLLTTREILTQYDRYNASAEADAGTQQILGALLDAIESRREEAGADHLPTP